MTQGVPKKPSTMANAKCRATSNLGTAPDTYLYSLARSGNDFATIGSDDSLRLFGLDLNATGKVQCAHDGIACLATLGKGFATGGRDGLVKCWDVRAKDSRVRIAEPKGRGFASIACHDHFIAAGTESAKEGLGDVNVLIYDTRNSSTPLRNYTESHTDTITQLAFNSHHPNVLLSGSTDGLVSIFDIEKEDEDDALMQVLNPRSAIHCAGFIRTNEVYTLTTDEQFSFHKIGDTSYANGASEIKVGDVRGKLNCTYVVSLAGCGQAQVMTVGHNVNQELSIVPLDLSNPANFGPIVDLPGAHGEEVVRDMKLLDDKNMAVSCGEDGNAKLWDLPSMLGRSSDAMDID